MRPRPALDAPTLRPPCIVQVGRLAVPVRLTFRAAAAILAETGADWLTPGGQVETPAEKLDVVLHALAYAAVGDTAPTPTQIRRSSLRLGLRDTLSRRTAVAAVWMDVFTACAADIHAGGTPRDDGDDARSDRADGETVLELLWTVARKRVGLTLNEFWDLTPRELTLLAQRAGAAERLEQQGRDYGFAVLAILYSSVHAGQDSEPATPGTYFPSLRTEAEREAAALEAKEDDARPEGAPTMAEMARDALSRLEAL